MSWFSHFLGSEYCRLEYRDKEQTPWLHTSVHIPALLLTKSLPLAGFSIFLLPNNKHNEYTGVYHIAVIITEDIIIITISVAIAKIKRDCV